MLSGRPKLQPVPPQSVAPLLTRTALMAVGALVFFFIARWLIDRDYLSGPLNLGYLTVVGLLTGYLLGLRLSVPVERFYRRVQGRVLTIPPDAVLAAGIGITVALVITVLLNVLLEAVPGYSWYHSLSIAALMVLASSWFFVANRGLFASRSSLLDGAAAPAPELTRAKVLDTSSIIDGRIVDVIACRFVDGPLLVPRFVLAELQGVADAEDPLKRKRGRRGLEVLDRLIKQPGVQTEVVAVDYPELSEVDAKLVRLCQERYADLITTDFNLNRIAGLQGVRVLNVNELANAVKSVFMPGEQLSLHIVKAGREPGQGLAYLEDGTMVVVEDAAHLVGKTVPVLVTSNLQTNMGRMVFAKLHAS